MNGKYDDIINLPHHKSLYRPQMTRNERAAQFLPFAALVGFSDIIDESARETEEKVLLSADASAEIELKLALLVSKEKGHPLIAVRYFAPDETKKGGTYLLYEGNLSKIDAQAGQLVFLDGKRLAIASIISLEGDVFLLPID